MAREVTNDYGNERTRFAVFTGALSGMQPGESVTVGFSILDETHILTAEKTGYGEVFVHVYDTDWGALVAEEYEIDGDDNDVRSAAADAVSTATNRYLRLRTEQFERVGADDLPETTG